MLPRSPSSHHRFYRAVGRIERFLSVFCRLYQRKILAVYDPTPRTRGIDSLQMESIPPSACLLLRDPVCSGRYHRLVFPSRIADLSYAVNQISRLLRRMSSCLKRTSQAVLLLHLFHRRRGYHLNHP